MMSEEFKKKNTIKWVVAAVYMILSSIFVPLSIVHMQQENALAAQASVKIPQTTQVQTTEPTTTEVAVIPEIKTVHLECSSVQNDLKIKLLDDKTGGYIEGIPFSVNVTDKAGKQTTYTNKDLKGLIYVTKVKAGEYTIKLTVPEGLVASADTATVLVKDKVAYKPIKDIKEKVSKNPLPKEDTKVPQDMVQEKVLQNTIEFVQSSKTTIPSQTTYVLVAFEKVKNPNPQEPTTGESTTEESTSTASTTNSTQLMDVDGKKLYIKVGDEYLLANANDYNQSNQFYKQEIIAESYNYTGWQIINDKRYYFDKNGNYVTGNQVINGAKYSFSNEGVLLPGFGVLGIDVSKYQGTINWKAVKSSGVQFVIIRAGFRGYGSGALVEDTKFKSNIQGALAAGLDVGIYFFSQAINEVEAVEEASLCIELAKGYRIKYPIFIDTETSGGNGTGRADSLSTAQRTSVCKAFCETIQSRGYRTGIYTSKSWFEKKLDMSQLSQYLIWLAQWTDKPTYGGKYDVWQYTSKGQVAGISGNVDMNFSYMTF